LGPDELWPDLVFAAQKLGFLALKLTLEQEQRIWRRLSTTIGVASGRFNYASTRYGSIELVGPACPLNGSRRDFECRRDLQRAGCPGNCVADPLVFETISELLVEAWNKAAIQWSRRRIPIRFNGKSARPLHLSANGNDLPGLVFSSAKDLRCFGGNHE
jgi:hypothetical protein